MKATEQFFALELFIMLYKVVLTFESVCETLNNIIVTIYGKWKLLRRSSLWLLCCTRWFKLFRHRVKSQSVTIQMKATDQYFLSFFLCYTSWFFPAMMFMLLILAFHCASFHTRIDSFFSRRFLNWVCEQLCLHFLIRKAISLVFSGCEILRVA